MGRMLEQQLVCSRVSVLCVSPTQCVCLGYVPTSLLAEPKNGKAASASFSLTQGLQALGWDPARGSWAGTAEEGSCKFWVNFSS